MSDSGLTVRPYAARDRAATSECFMMAVRRTASAHYSEDQLKAWAPDGMDEIRWGNRRMSARTIVAELEGEVIGFSDLSKSGHIDMLFVHPTAARRGVATALLSTLVEQASREGLTRMTTHASRTARQVFERAGFNVEVEQEVVTNGVMLVNYRMVRTSENAGTRSRS